MASDSSSSFMHEEQSIDVFHTLELNENPRENSPSNDSHSSGPFSPIQLDPINDELEHDADSDSSGGDMSFDPYRNKLQERKKTKRRTSSNVFTFKDVDNHSNNLNGGQFDVVDLGLTSISNNRNATADTAEKPISVSTAKSRRADMKWTNSKSFSSSTDETDVKIVPVSATTAKSLLTDHDSLDMFLFPSSENEKIMQQPAEVSSNSSDNSGGGDTKKNKAVDGLLFEIYDKYHGIDHANVTTESDITELSTTSITSIYVASSFENEDRPRLDKNYLQTKELVELEKMVKELKRGISMLSSKLVKLLKQRDRNAHKIQENFNVLTALLQAISQKRRVDTRIRFSFVPRPGKQGFRQWVDALKAVSRISHGIPPTWRKRTWLSLAEYFLKDVEWERFKKLCFNDRRNPDDDELDTQIVKDLHRTGCGWFFEHDTAEDRASLKRVLLAYARWNKQIGYCQGFNVIAALILQVMEGNEEHALKVMIFLVDYVLPRNYFSNNLRALSVDMAVLRDLMQMKLPSLAQHLQRLQKEAMDQSANSVASYEPPLINMFTMQWFLTLFATCLPRDTVLRIWDAVLLEGSEVLLRVALAIWAKLGSFFDNVNTAADFYMQMGRLIQELMTDEFIDVQKLLQVVYQMAQFPWSAVSELREKYTYDIHPFATFRADRKGDRKSSQKKTQPKPVSDDEDIDVDEAMVGCLGFVATSGVDPGSSPSKTIHRRHPQQKQLQEQHHNGGETSKNKSVPVTSKTDITKVTPGAYITDQDARAYKEQMLAKELLRETEKLDLGKLRNQYGRMRRLQQKAMLVFNADDFKDESYKVKNPPSAINHLFVDVNNVTAPPRARYRKPSNFPALKAPSKGNPSVLKPAKDSGTPKFVYENNAERKSSGSYTEENKKSLERSDSFSITNPYVMHEVQDEENHSRPATTNPGAHAEIMKKSVPLNSIKSPPARSNTGLDEGDMKSTSLLYKVDKSALYPSNFKPFPSRNSSRRKMVPGK